MKIERVELYKYPAEIPTVHFSKNIVASENKRIFVVIKVITDKGQAGYSMAGHFVHQAYHAIVEGICQAAEFMLAKSPWDRLSIWEYLRVMERRGILPSQAFGAIDVALWDLCGKIAEEPISHLLGRGSRSLPVYASCQKHDTIDEYIEEIGALQQKGIKRYKLHPTGHLDQDIQLSEEIYKQYNGQIKYMFDGTFNYSLSEAILLGKVLDKYGFFWLEDPLKEPKLDAYRHLYEKIVTPLAVGDLSPSLDSQSIAAYMCSNCFDIVKPDVAYKGGITGSKRMAQIAAAHGLDCDVHHGGNPLLNVATLHLMSSLNNVSAYEWIIPEGLHDYGILDYPKPDEEGLIHCPEGPGLGVQLDFESLTKYPVKSISV